MNSFYKCTEIKQAIINADKLIFVKRETIIKFVSIGLLLKQFFRGMMDSNKEKGNKMNVKTSLLRSDKHEWITGNQRQKHD